MDNTEALNIAQRFANAVKLKFNYTHIILFGSYAKGNFNEDSDIDIAIVFEDYSNFRPPRLSQIKVRAFRKPAVNLYKENLFLSGLATHINPWPLGLPLG